MPEANPDHVKSEPLPTVVEQLFSVALPVGKALLPNHAHIVGIGGNAIDEASPNASHLG